MNQIGGQSLSSIAFSTVTMDSSVKKEEVGKVVRVLEQLETQVKSFQQLLTKPTEYSNVLLNTLTGIIQKSKAELNGNVKNVLAAVKQTSSSQLSSFSNDVDEFGQLWKFYKSIKTVIKTFKTVQDIGQDENLALILPSLDSVLILLKELVSPNQNPGKKRKIEFMEEEEASTENNNDDNNSVAMTLEKKVFGNHLIAKSVFKYLSPSDLFSCRLMSSYWKEYATEILLKTDFKIKIGRCINRFYVRWSNWKSLDMFTEFLKTSKQFPCNKFDFRGGNLGNDDAQRFFNFYGSAITSIYISYFDRDLEKDMDKSEDGFVVGKTDSRTLGTILSKQLPNLECVELVFHYKNGNDWPGFKSLLFPPASKIELPHLTTLIYHGYDEYNDENLFRQLLQAAINLKRLDFEPFQIKYLEICYETGKAKTIISVMLFSENLVAVEEMVEYEPELEELYLEELYKNSKDWTRISTVLSKLFCSSEKSLNFIDFQSFGCLSELEIPILENLRNVSLKVMNKQKFPSKDVNEYSYAFLPRGASFSRNFPRLDKIEFDFESLASNNYGAFKSSGTGSGWSKFFPIDEIVPTVKKINIKYSRHCAPLWLEKIGEMFPNVEELSIDRIDEIRSISKIIWTSFTKLKHLTLEIDLSSPLNAYPALDTCFTGLSPKTFKNLEKLSTAKLESELNTKKYMENQPSLLNLTNLETLDIDLKFYSNVSNYKYPKILTPVTGICVFKPLESLQKVNLQYSDFKATGIDSSSITRQFKLLKPFKVEV